jgi:hypothetical protein
MRDSPLSEPKESTARNRPRVGGRAALWGLLAVVLAFFIGFFWQFYQATTVRRALSTTEQELVVERLRVQLASAAIAAQGGRFEDARIEMSEFFTRIQPQQWALPPDLRRVADEFLAMRDDVITGLSRSDPEYADALFGMLDRFERTMPRLRDPRPSDTPQLRTPPGDPDTEP